MPENNNTAFDKYQRKDALEREIRFARDKMQKLWNERGHTDDEVLGASIKLDILLNEYQKMMPFYK